MVFHVFCDARGAPTQLAWLATSAALALHGRRSLGIVRSRRPIAAASGCEWAVPAVTGDVTLVRAGAWELRRSMLTNGEQSPMAGLGEARGAADDVLSGCCRYYLKMDVEKACRARAIASAGPFGIAQAERCCYHRSENFFAPLLVPCAAAEPGCCLNAIAMFRRGEHARIRQ